MTEELVHVRWHIAMEASETTITWSDVHASIFAAATHVKTPERHICASLCPFQTPAEGTMNASYNESYRC